MCIYIQYECAHLYIMYMPGMYENRFSAGRGSFLALSAAGHVGGRRVYAGASLGPCRAPWRVFWVFKVA